MTKGSDNEFPSVLYKEGSAPANPAAGDQRTFIDSADHKFKRVNSSGTVTTIEGGGGSAVANSARVLYTGGDKTTTSSTFVDVDATNAKLTLTTGARGVLIGVTVTVKGTVATDLSLDIDIDGTLQGQTFGLVDVYLNTTGNAHNASFTYLTAALTAASHTFKLKWKIGSGTATMFASSTVPLHMWAIEQQS